MTTPQHDDPLGEGRSQLLQAFAVLTTVGESAARFAVAGAQNQAARTERQAQAAQTAAAGHEHADRVTASARAEQHRIARRLMDKAFDQQWLDGAGIGETAELWRTAAIYESSGDTRAQQAMNRAETRLRQLNPDLMDAYTRHRRGGKRMAEAMLAAAHDVWLSEARTRGTHPARAHGNTGDGSPALRANGPAIGAVPDPRGLRMVDDLEAATRAEVARLADGVDPELLDRLQRQWRSAGHPPAADAVVLLLNAARQLRTAAYPDDASAADTRPAAADRNSADRHARPGLAGYELAAQGLERAAKVVQAEQAAERPRTSAADRDVHAGTVDHGVPDLAGAPADGQRDGVATEAGAGQRLRLGRAFLPLTAVNPTSSAPGNPSQARPPQRKEKNR